MIWALSWKSPSKELFPETNSLLPGFGGGVADTAPYLHDGRALTIKEAILLHGGEAEESRDAFAALSAQEMEALLSFLDSLRTPTKANQVK